MRKKNLKQGMLLLSSLLTGFFFTILIIMLIFDKKTSDFKLSKLVKYIENEDNYLEISKYYNTKIKTTDDTIVITFSNDKINSQLKGELKGDILTFTIPKNDENILIKGKLLYSIADGIGQVNGNKKGYVSSLLGTLDYSTINIKKNGIEIYASGGNNIYKFKINKKFVLGSIADIYFTNNDLVNYKDKFLSEDYFQTTKGNLILYKINEDNKNYIYLCEPDELTTRTYESLINIVSVIYGDNNGDLFSKAYKKISSMKYQNLNIIANYKSVEGEVIYNKLLSNYKILKIEIN